MKDRSKKILIIKIKVFLRKNAINRLQLNADFAKRKLKFLLNNLLPAFHNVCKDSECIKLCDKFCNKILGCSHPCNGFSNE
jgi:hypothetical protein